MSSRRTKKTLTPKEEENGRRRLMALQMDDFDPRRVEKSRTADDEEKSVYVEEKKQLEGVKAWGSLAPVTERVADKRSTKEAQTIMTMEDNASNSKRIEIISTTDSHVNPPFIYWKSVRLRHIDNVNEEGLPSEKVDAVMVRRPATADSTGKTRSTDAFDLDLERLAYHSITTSQGFSYASFLLGCLTALGLSYIYFHLIKLQ